MHPGAKFDLTILLKILFWYFLSAFINLNSYEGTFLLSYFIEHEMGAEVMESYLGTFAICRAFKMDDLEFMLLTNDDFGICLRLLQHDKSNIESLRQIAHELLSLVKAKGRNFVSKKGQKLISASWDDLIRKARGESEWKSMNLWTGNQTSQY